MIFESAKEKDIFFEAVGLLNKLMGMLECKEDIILDNRNNLKVLTLKGGATEKINNGQSIINNSLLNQQGDNEELAKLKNIRQRADGRWEWRKTIKGISHFIIKKTQKELFNELKQFEKNISTTQKIVSKKQSFEELCWSWLNLYKKDISSKQRYESVLKNYFKNLTMPIQNLTKEFLQNFLNNIKTHRNRDYAYFIIKGVFQEEQDKRSIKYNVAINLKKPINEGKKGINFSLQEQKLILNNLDKTNIGNEILFYILTGCRKNEAFRIDINFEKNIIYVAGTKTSKSKRYIPISKDYSLKLKENLATIFLKSDDFYSREFTKYLKLLKIQNKTLHCLRHTFSTNLYYLGVTDKQRQYLLGHSSIDITNDIYTHLDPSITKNDILKLYNNLYPNFDIIKV